MKFGSVTKVEKRDKTTAKTFDDDFMSENCDAIAIFPIYGQFGAIWKPDSGRIVLKLIFSLTVTFYVIKTEKRTKKSLTQLSQYCFE